VIKWLTPHHRGTAAISQSGQDLCMVVEKARHY
jgi:hypothetical protein